ncbi:ATP-binding cassette domain-containing protein [Pseudooceanicola sediminis]|uniref:ATP-binding cassette domain-containing protein n=1 Tax=Pseudooceanicola sediminis TaxID=2211117 RepID=A0A399J6N4_9RHOB|nr:ATP-binding cassette domain-containing protein [Pseudooceanicola sediminis]KAA2314202.1 ATP-binding cassette domain-containing protein [Puniceibacterium sp. HSS470]RII39939.1 ATP-binding cassette domain-containing protein [Pseudooceanicola sediminis]|tara:strand:+ start:104597 stop:105349 length:753 start_codon:yes stop_codon:yes gene_type:complete
MIRLSGVSHFIGGAQILHDISLDLPKGGITALIGPNGAGKSTLLSLIARLTPLKQGEITVDTLKIGGCSDRDLARVLAIMAQSTHVSARLRVRELVGFGRYPWHRGRPGPADHALIEAALERFGLLPIADRFLDEISGGQRQRAFVAMAFAQDTDYLLLDEPLNNLDIAGARGLMRLLRDMADRDDKTILIVLHDINYAAAFADRIVALKNGRIAATGAPDQVISDTLLRDVFDTDAKISRIDGRPFVMV